MYSIHKLRELGLVPKKDYKLGQTFPKDWKHQPKIDHETFFGLPLYMSIMYSVERDENGMHTLNKRHLET